MRSPKKGINMALWRHEKTLDLAAEILAAEHGIRHEAGTHTLCPACSNRLEESLVGSSDGRAPAESSEVSRGNAGVDNASPDRSTVDSRSPGGRGFDSHPTSDSTSVTVRIVAPHFVAGVDIEPRERIVVFAAPIVAYMRGWSAQRVRDYCDAKGWEAKRIPLAPAIPVTHHQERQK